MGAEDLYVFGTQGVRMSKALPNIGIMFHRSINFAIVFNSTLIYIETPILWIDTLLDDPLNHQRTWWISLLPRNMSVTNVTDVTNSTFLVYSAPEHCQEHWLTCFHPLTGCLGKTGYSGQALTLGEVILEIKCGLANEMINSHHLDSC